MLTVSAVASRSTAFTRRTSAPTKQHMHTYLHTSRPHEHRECFKLTSWSVDWCGCHWRPPGVVLRATSGRAPRDPCVASRGRVVATRPPSRAAPPLAPVTSQTNNTNMTSIPLSQTSSFILTMRVITSFSSFSCCARLSALSASIMLYMNVINVSNLDTTEEKLSYIAA